MCDKMGAVGSESMDPTELNSRARLELGEISSNASGEGSSSTTSTVSTHWVP